MLAWGRKFLQEKEMKELSLVQDWLQRGKNLQEERDTEVLLMQALMQVERYAEVEIERDEVA